MVKVLRGINDPKPPPSPESFHIAEMCKRVETKILAQLPAVCGINVNCVYTKRDFLRTLGLGDESWRQMKAAGLKTAMAGTKAVVRGAEFQRWVQEHEK